MRMMPCENAPVSMRMAQVSGVARLIEPKEQYETTVT